MTKTHIKTPYEFRKINTVDLIVPKEYQRSLNQDKVNEIVAKFDENILNEPKVSYRNGRYYGFDGQPTIAALKKMNGGKDLFIICKVYTGFTEAQEALLFALQNGSSSAISSGATMKALIFGGDPEAIAFLEATEEVGFHLGYTMSPGLYRINCINTAFGLYRKHGKEVYQTGLRILKGAWEGNPDSLRSKVLCAVYDFITLYYGEYKEDRLIGRLQAADPKALYWKGMLDTTLQGSKRFLNQIYRTYNGFSKVNALPLKF